MYILAIDPGNIECGYVVLDKSMYPLEKGKVKNEELLEKIWSSEWEDVENVAIEMIASYGMAVGKSVFDTCVCIGRFHEALDASIPKFRVEFIYRKDEKLEICGNMKAKDSNIRQALIDKYSKHDFKNGKGTKKNQS
ncbi:hypothetical protein [Clostridium hydrogeniformans]|uniref:hypothetical protein n=1 Tax=Clostridium hydrogeniformans TaxID=349933 RepID=UPI000ACC4FE7|nr:hypothetical protein [Clostridium hydrogeniformans]